MAQGYPLQPHAILDATPQLAKHVAEAIPRGIDARLDRVAGLTADVERDRTEMEVEILRCRCGRGIGLGRRGRLSGTGEGSVERDGGREIR